MRERFFFVFIVYICHFLREEALAVQQGVFKCVYHNVLAVEKIIPAYGYNNRIGIFLYLPQSFRPTDFSAPRRCHNR